MAELYHQVWIAAPSATVYEAIATEAGIAGWWDTPKAVRSDSGVVLEFSPGPEHGVLRAKVVAAIPDRRIEWEFVSTHPRNSPAFAWTGTRVSFEITRRAVPPWAAERVDTAIVDFRHIGWDERSEYLGFCNFAWAKPCRSSSSGANRGRPSPSASPRRPVSRPRPRPGPCASS